jgi:CheY-like chemotaxis protein
LCRSEAIRADLAYLGGQTVHQFVVGETDGDRHPGVVGAAGQPGADEDADACPVALGRSPCWYWPPPLLLVMVLTPGSGRLSDLVGGLVVFSLVPAAIGVARAAAPALRPRRRRQPVPGVRGALAVVLAAGYADNGVDAVPATQRTQPDVVLMDLAIPTLNGIEATCRIVASSPHVAVLVLTMYDDDESVSAAMRAGAGGYLLKGADQEDIARAVAAVSRGEAIFGPSVARRIIDPPTSLYRIGDGLPEIRGHSHGGYLRQSGLADYLTDEATRVAR